MTDTNCRDNPEFLGSAEGQAWIRLNKENGSVKRWKKNLSKGCKSD